MVHVPAQLRECCGGEGRVAVAATNVAAVLGELERNYPVLHRSVCDETGAVRRHINVFVNSLHIRDCHGLATPLEPGDEVTILPAVSGG